LVAEGVGLSEIGVGQTSREIAARPSSVFAAFEDSARLEWVKEG